MAARALRLLAGIGIVFAVAELDRRVHSWQYAHGELGLAVLLALALAFGWRWRGPVRTRVAGLVLIGCYVPDALSAGWIASWIWLAESLAVLGLGLLLFAGPRPLDHRRPTPPPPVLPGPDSVPERSREREHALS